MACHQQVSCMVQGAQPHQVYMGHAADTSAPATLMKLTPCTSTAAERRRTSADKHNTVMLMCMQGSQLVSSMCCY